MIFLKRAVLIVLLFSIPFIMASNVSIQYPSEVTVGKEFDMAVQLLNFSAGDYDMKIEIKNGTKTLAKVYTNNVLTSTYYWIKHAFSGEGVGTFRVMIHEPYEGIIDFTVKIRDATNTWVFGGNKLTIKNKALEQREPEKKEERSSLELEWNEDSIINGEEFEIKIAGEDFSGKDVRIWIEHEGVIISERYDTKNKQWKSGLFYVNDFEEDTMLLRIKEEVRDFTGDAPIILKIRDGDSYTDKIEILEKKSIQEKEGKENKTVVLSPQREKEVNNSEEIEKVIQLGTGNALVESLSTHSLIYESKTERIKRYSLYAFTVICVALCALLVWRRLE